MNMIFVVVRPTNGVAFVIFTFGGLFFCMEKV